MLARPILFRVGPCFGLLFSGRARAGPKSPAQIPSTTLEDVAVASYYHTDSRESIDHIIISDNTLIVLFNPPPGFVQLVGMHYPLVRAVP